jgi:hypothetical protein
VALAAYTGADKQMWRLDQFADGGWRIVNKADGLSLNSASGGMMLDKFQRDDTHLWTITTP